jgi:serine/threonine protein kinase/Flp pilus assembly protein TadD
MNPSRWSRIKSAFSKARARERSTLVFRNAASSTVDEVRNLLAFAGTDSKSHLTINSFESAEAATTQPLLEVGTNVSDRFTVIRLLGRGGMGEVYEAEDRLKQLPVALKVLRPCPTLDPHVAERLLRKEVALSQRISHRNVCRIHDPYRHHSIDGKPVLLLSMELLNGQTLGDLSAARGRLTLDEVIPLARQLAAGIDAAHSAGVIHRDLKPSNVMLVPEQNDTRLVITDFGLAHAVFSGNSTITFSGAVAGTLRYMAPEQLDGQADTRSDLYAFCLLLFELITGELPFAGNSDIAIALSRLHHPARDPGSLVPGLPLQWRATLLQGLDRDPRRRFSTGHQIVSNLESPAHLTAIIRGLILPPLLRNHLWLAWALVLLLLAIGSAILIQKPHQNAFPPFSRLLFVNLGHGLSGDPVPNALGASLSEAIGQSPRLLVSRPADLAETLSRMGMRPGRSLDKNSVHQLALRTGQEAVLSETVSRGKLYVLHLQIESVSADPRVPSATLSKNFEARDEQALFDAVASAARWVRDLAGDRIRDFKEQDARPEDLTTPSWSALSLLQQARDRRDANDPQAALIFAGEALQLDPNFASAESLRGDLLIQLRQYKEAFAAHRHALDLAKVRNITGRERYEIEAIYDEDAEDYDALFRNYQAWSAHFPKDYRPHFYLANLFYDRGDYNSAVVQMEAARTLEPKNYTIYPHLATYYLGAGQFAQASECAHTLRQLGETNWALAVESHILLMERKFDDAVALLRPLQAERDDVFSAVVPLYIATTLADSGRLKEAQNVLTAAAAQDARIGLKARAAERQVAIAYISYELGDYQSVRSALTRSLSDLDDPETISFSGALFARTGDLAMAWKVLKTLERWSMLPVAKNATVRLQAEISLAQRSPASSALVAEVDTRTQTPLVIDFLLNAASILHRNEQLARLRGRILKEPDLLLRWDDWTALPGLFWRAQCARSATSQRGSASACQVLLAKRS